MKSLFHTNSLATRMIAVIAMVVVLTAIIAGVPGILTIREQLDKQAWSQVEQGIINTETLYAARQNELVAFAKLIAHRTCLQGLIKAGDNESALEHLYDLRSGTEIELVMVCDHSRDVLASTVNLPLAHICASIKEKGFVIIPEKQASRVWVIGSHMIGEPEDRLGWAVAGIRAETALANPSLDQVGLKFSFLLNNQPILTNFELSSSDLNAIFPVASINRSGEVIRRIFEQDGESYYAMRKLVEAPNLEYEVALSTADVTAAQQQLMWLLIGSLGVVIVMGSLAGVFISRYISQPLEQLSETAVVFSSGNLSAPVSIQTDLREVALVARALEGARIELLQTMTELRRERAWVNHLVQSIVEGILTLDEGNQITFFSRGAERITGWKREQVLNRPIDEVFFLPDSSLLLSDLIPDLGKETKVLVELSGGRWATLSITGAVLSPAEAGDGEIALVFRDVSDEQVIHRRLGNFMANVAHEFRTPLSALAASIELLLDQAPSTDPAEVQGLLGSLHLGIFRLQTLVDNLIESASIEAGHFRVSPHYDDLNKIIHDTELIMNPLLAKYGQRLQIEVPDSIPMVWVDSRRTVQILVNLLSNANKYGPPDSAIMIRAAVENGYVKLTVIDQGPGIPPEQREQIFHRFKSKTPATLGPKAGAGLGLSVVKAIAEAQGGQTGVEDCPIRGSGFWFTVKTEGET
jgi:PAS domain S-box-containing protein